MAAESSSGGAGVSGKITAWPKDDTLNMCNVPTEQKAFIRYFACEWMKNQPIGNAHAQAMAAIQSAQALYSILASRGYMN